MDFMLRPHDSRPAAANHLLSAHLEHGQALLKSVQRDAARQEFEQTLRLDPANGTARQYLGR
jgi:hypothetical protein